MAGPVATALEGAGGAIIGALTGAGLSGSVATEYRDAMEKGHIIISVEPKDENDAVLTSEYGREIYIGHARAYYFYPY